MLEIDDKRTIGEAWDSAVATYSARPFLVIPANAGRDYLPEGLELTYAQADIEVRRLAEAWADAGYGLGHRVATLLENRPQYILLKMALNRIGVSLVPINPEYRPAEIAYLVEHAEPEVVVVLASRIEQVTTGLAECETQPAVLVAERIDHPPPPRLASTSHAPKPTSESCILYTSGTTGRPKGCILSHGYEIACGAWYAQIGGLAAFRPEGERIYNPLPLYHCNSGTVSLWGAIASGSCQIQSDRFHPERWWREIAQTRASVVHYLGVIAPMLLKQPPSPADRNHAVRFGIGAGVEPQLHAVFEARFGFPLVEIWGMTEMVRVLGDNFEPRRVGERAFGRAVVGVDVRVVDESDNAVPDGTPGEMLVRHSAATPRRGAFSGYLKNEEETEKAWRGGWFHTGDVVWRGADGMHHFVDRKKNIIRRSGENIAAAEVEALLLTRADVKQAAVMPLTDEVREEEVLACLVLKGGDDGSPPPAADRDLAEAIFRYCHERLAYYKAPGWIWFADALPVTGSQKIQKHAIFPGIADPRTAPGMHDLRDLKRRR
jgi:acyl-CoA synthetase (AMP-forming)/AMP-acid ligase II